jgi:hypothetical protein
MGGAELNGRQIKTHKKSLIGANKTGLAQADPYVLVLALHNVSGTVRRPPEVTPGNT